MTPVSSFETAWQIISTDDIPHTELRGIGSLLTKFILKPPYLDFSSLNLLQAKQEGKSPMLWISFLLRLETTDWVSIEP